MNSGNDNIEYVQMGPYTQNLGNDLLSKKCENLGFRDSSVLGLGYLASYGPGLKPHRVHYLSNTNWIGSCGPITLAY